MNEPALPLSDYDHILVMFSAGKDSLATVLHLLEIGAPRKRIELWHHEIDGREGSKQMDWPCTPDYCRKFAAAFDLPLYFSWKVGGFEREMLRNETPTAATKWENPDATIGESGGKGPLGTRRKFPQVGADLRTRWCSAYLKIDVAAMAIRNQERFNGKKVLVVTGERAEESPCRAKYATAEPHRTDNREGKSGRLVDQWRPIHGWSERDVWTIIERWNVNPHPCYKLGWGRCSCAACIFGNPNQWASLRKVNAIQFFDIAERESIFGVTIRRDGSVIDAANRGEPYAAITDAGIDAALSVTFDEPILLAPGTWKLPAGAYGDLNGPS
jgi:3'-phosphoadenosine 5'-phosphosulfate sulfotransferase (PAPS reductase)/FAD synthetase